MAKVNETNEENLILVLAGGKHMVVCYDNVHSWQPPCPYNMVWIYQFCTMKRVDNGNLNLKAQLAKRMV